MSDNWEINNDYRKKKGKTIIPLKDRVPVEKIDSQYVIKAELNEQQKRILDLVYRFRMMDTTDIQKALGYKSYGRLTSSLRKLHKLRFLDRRRRPAEKRFDSKGANGEYELFHMIDYAGVQFIKDYYGMEKLSDVKWRPEENQVKFDYAVHSLKISESYARLAEAVRATDSNGNPLHPDEYIIDAWSDKHLYLRFYSGKEYVFYPDMFFKYYKDKKAYGFFVEIDQGTMAMTGSPNTTTFDDKVMYYEGYRESKSNYLGFAKMPKCLVITTTKERAEGLAKAVKAKQIELDKAGVRFLFTFNQLWDINPFGAIFIDQDYETNRKAISMFD